MGHQSTPASVAGCLLLLAQLLCSCQNTQTGNEAADLAAPAPADMACAIGNWMPGCADLKPPPPPPDMSYVCSAQNCTGPGQLCQNNVCVTDCRMGMATSCAAGTVCDYISGVCKVAGECVLEASYEDCTGGLAQRCGPGAMCAADGRCVPDGTCGATLVCEGTRCYAQGCACDRVAACAPAALAEMNKAPLNSSPWDIKFDALCNTYVTTLISGKDYVRMLPPAAAVVNFPGVGDMDTQEVAPAPLPVGATAPGEVAFSYYLGGGPGIGRIDRANPTQEMPILVRTAVTGAAGPISAIYEGGPLGLIFGQDGKLYVGNVNQQGDYHQVDLVAKTTTAIYTGSKRVYAAAPVDGRRIALGLNDRTIVLLDVVSKTVQPFATVDGDIASLQRDRFTKRIYAALSNPARVVSVSPDGKTVSPFQSAPGNGRIGIAPDGYLYHVTSLVNAVGTFTRWQLPARR